MVLHVGGNYGQNQNHGAFYLNGNNAASNANANIGCRPLAGWHTSLLRFKPFPRFDIDGWNGRAALAGDCAEGTRFSTPERAWEIPRGNKEKNFP